VAAALEAVDADRVALLGELQCLVKGPLRARLAGDGDLQALLRQLIDQMGEALALFAKAVGRALRFKTAASEVSGRPRPRFRRRRPVRPCSLSACEPRTSGRGASFAQRSSRQEPTKWGCGTPEPKTCWREHRETTGPRFHDPGRKKRYRKRDRDPEGNEAPGRSSRSPALSPTHICGWRAARREFQCRAVFVSMSSADPTS
jgi:hypothetical protein